METQRPRLARYRNPCHSPSAPQYGPPEYETDAQPVEYRGHLIYERIKGQCWDVVRDGECVMQMAGPDGARRWVDGLVELGQEDIPAPARSRRVVGR